jgi:hypothetical protein
MAMLRSAMIAGVVAMSCVGMISQADAQMRGGGFGGFNGGHGGFNGGFNHPGFGHPGFGANRFFFGFGFPGFGYGGYPYYPYYPAYYPAYYPPYPAYPPYSGYPATASTVYPAYSAHPAAASPGAPRAVDPTTVLVQSELQRQGYDVGPIDGLLGPRTRAAIREYEQRNGLSVDGLPSRSLLDHMQAHQTG